jgi:hypothetical protein
MTTLELQALITLAAIALIFLIRVRTGHPPRWLRRREQTARAGPRRPARLGATTKATVVAVVVGGVPWLVYLLVRPHVDTTAQALMIASAIPLAWALARSARRRRVDASSLVVVVAYAAAVVLSVLLGGSALTFKLRDVAALAAVGLACLVSLAFRRPLLLTALQIIVRHRNDADTLRRRLADPATQHDLGAATALTGTLFALAAATDGLLIATVSTATFLAVSGPLGGLAPLAAIAATIALLRHRSRRRSSNLLRPANPLPPTGADINGHRHAGAATTPSARDPDKPAKPSGT